MIRPRRCFDPNVNADANIRDALTFSSIPLSGKTAMSANLPVGLLPRHACGMIGGILDMSSLYADITGSGSLEADKMAAEDAGGEVLGRKIEVIAADHLNKADLAANIARDMIDNQGVEMIYDVAASATALAALEVTKARNKITMFNGPGSIRLSNEACGPYTIHYVLD